MVFFFWKVKIEWWLKLIWGKNLGGGVVNFSLILGLGSSWDGVKKYGWIDIFFFLIFLWNLVNKFGKFWMEKGKFLGW